MRRALPLMLALSAASAFGQTAATQQQSAPPLASPTRPDVPDVPPISPFTADVPTGLTGLPATTPARSAPAGLVPRHFFGPYRRPVVPELFPGNGTRLRSLVRDGKLYLSAREAIALAIENNLDVEIERYNLLLADTDRLRAAGGGSLRGIDFTIQEPPNGVGGPGSPC